MAKVAKDQADYVQENTQRAIHSANLGTMWMAQIVELNLNQGKAAVEACVPSLIKLPMVLSTKRPLCVSNVFRSLKRRHATYSISETGSFKPKTYKNGLKLKANS